MQDEKAKKPIEMTSGAWDSIGSIQLFDNLIGYKQAARFLSISEPYLRRLKSRGEIPWVQIGRRGVRFRLSSLRQWAEEREIK